jgi:uncharacterized protein YbjT (DUF2867 family)
MSDRLILVTGATGRQGGAVVRNLVQAGGWKVRAMTRDPSKSSSKVLEQMGVQVVRGDLDDRASIESAAQGAYGVFSIQDPWAHGVAKEIAQGIALADVAKAVGVRHFVFASVSTAEQRTGVPHFESKGTIERHIQSLNLPYTFMRPAFFMDMLLRKYEPRANVMWGALRRALGTSKKVQLVAVDDIGAVVSKAFTNPDRYLGKAIELAGDELSVQEASAIYKSVTGEAPKVLQVPLFLVSLVNHEAALNFRWIGRKGWRIDVPASRSEHSLKTFESWLPTVMD